MSQKIYELAVFTTFSSDIKSKYKIALRECVLIASIYLTRRNRLVCNTTTKAITQGNLKPNKELSFIQKNHFNCIFTLNRTGQCNSYNRICVTTRNCTKTRVPN